jgi:CRP/FNR family cyclic AMP-dependent transcriptional regulator
VPRRFSAGETVFGEGEPCAGLYVVESGHVRILKSSASGREQVLSVDGPGSSIAELPVFDGGNYPASVTASTTPRFCLSVNKTFRHSAWLILKLRSRCCAWSVPGFDGWWESSRSYHLQQCGTGWLRSFCALPEPKASARLTEWKSLCRSATRNWRHRSERFVRLVSRNLSRFQSEGLVRIDGRSVIIYDLKALEAELRFAE